MAINAEPTNYFEVVRSMTDDPTVRAAVDSAEEDEKRQTARDPIDTFFSDLPTVDAFNSPRELARGGEPVVTSLLERSNELEDKARLLRSAMGYYASVASRFRERHPEALAGLSADQQAAIHELADRVAVVENEE